MRFKLRAEIDYICRWQYLWTNWSLSWDSGCILVGTSTFVIINRWAYNQSSSTMKSRAWLNLSTTIILIIIKIRDVLTKKTAVLLDFVQITPPPPQFRQLVQLFSDVKIQDLKVSLGLKILYIHTTYIQPKQQFKFQIIGILEEIDSYYWPKMHLWKDDKQDKVNYAVSEREDRVTDLTTLRRRSGCIGMYWAVLGSTGVLDLTRLHWDLIGWGGHWSGGSGGPGGQDNQHRWNAFRKIMVFMV